METINNWWTNFAQKHKLVAQFVKFYAFSLFVTVLQYLLLTFLPGLFYNLTDWCSIPCQLIHLNLGPVDTYVFNYPVTGDATGGMGYFAALAITLFLVALVPITVLNGGVQMVIYFPIYKIIFPEGGAD